MSAAASLTAVLAAPADGRTAAAASFAEAVKAAGNMKAAGVFEDLKKALDDADANRREAAVVAYAAIAGLGLRAIEPPLVALLSLVLERMADKIVSVRDAAAPAVKAFSDTVSPDAVKSLLPTLFSGMASAKQWCAASGLRRRAAAHPRR